MSTLISDEYREQLETLRKNLNPRWGNGGQRHVAAIGSLVGATETVLDYGCGLGMLMSALSAAYPNLVVNGYDPGIPERAASPEPADFLVSTDVLEHVEPDKLVGVLTHMRFLTGRMAYLNIHTGPAKQLLPDGRNAHLIQQPAAWWQAELQKYFSKVERYTPATFGDTRPSFVCHD